MSEDQHDGESFESTLEVDKARLMAEVSRDRESSKDEGRQSPTVRMPAVEPDTRVERNPLLAAEDGRDNDGKTIPMPAIGEDRQNELETTNFSVPDELLEQISRPEKGNRWETMELLIEEIDDSEVSEVESADEHPDFVLEKIADSPDQSFEGELSSRRTSPILYRMAFEAIVNEDGTISIPRKYLDSGHVRPGMRFKVEAMGMSDD